MPSWLSPAWLTGRMLSMGIADGFVTGFPIATVSPDANGTFQIDLPYFRADAEVSSSQPRASFQLTLRDAKTWNHIASNLEPEKRALRLKQHELRIRSQYLDDLIFTAEPFAQRSAFKGKVFRSDSGEAISNSYIRLTSEEDQAKHFDTRTDEKGGYRFGGIPAGSYKVSIYAWFPKRSGPPAPTTQAVLPSSSTERYARWSNARSARSTAARLRFFAK